MFGWDDAAHAVGEESMGPPKFSVTREYSEMREVSWVTGTPPARTRKLVKGPIFIVASCPGMGSLLTDQCCHRAHFHAACSGRGKGVRRVRGVADGHVNCYLSYPQGRPSMMF